MTEQRKTGHRKDAEDTGSDEGRARQAEEIGHDANVNQVRHEPIPASHHDDRGKEAVVRQDDSAQGES